MATVIVILREKNAYWAEKLVKRIYGLFNFVVLQSQFINFMILFYCYLLKWHFINENLTGLVARPFHRRIQKENQRKKKRKNETNYIRTIDALFMLIIIAHEIQLFALRCDLWEKRSSIMIQACSRLRSHINTNKISRMIHSNLSI